MLFENWYREVELLAGRLGFSEKVVKVFKHDLIIHFESGLTPQEAVEIEF